MVASFALVTFYGKFYFPHFYPPIYDYAIIYCILKLYIGIVYYHEVIYYISKMIKMTNKNPKTEY